mmetsp:Transcript_82248/g.164404  ORF Transcript_82248/g.164404 Transcript_82248/m.164404 type:complete len:277 (+) Transcript_82248:828-1658(+)
MTEASLRMSVFGAATGAVAGPGETSIGFIEVGAVGYVAGSESSLAFVRETAPTNAATDSSGCAARAAARRECLATGLGAACGAHSVPFNLPIIAPSTADVFCFLRSFSTGAFQFEGTRPTGRWERSSERLGSVLAFTEATSRSASRHTSLGKPSLHKSLAKPSLIGTYWLGNRSTEGSRFSTGGSDSLRSKRRPTDGSRFSTGGSDSLRSKRRPTDGSRLSTRPLDIDSLRSKSWPTLAGSNGGTRTRLLPLPPPALSADNSSNSGSLLLALASGS